MINEGKLVCAVSVREIIHEDPDDTFKIFLLQLVPSIWLTFVVNFKD